MAVNKLFLRVLCVLCVYALELDVHLQYIEPAGEAVAGVDDAAVVDVYVVDLDRVLRRHRASAVCLNATPERDIGAPECAVLTRACTVASRKRAPAPRSGASAIAGIFCSANQRLRTLGQRHLPEPAMACRRALATAAGTAPPCMALLPRAPRQFENLHGSPHVI